MFHDYNFYSCLISPTFSHVYMFHHPWHDDANSKLFGPHVLFSIPFLHMFSVQGEDPVSLSIQSIAIYHCVCSNLHDLYARSCKVEHYAIYMYVCIYTYIHIYIYPVVTEAFTFYAPNIYGSKKWHIVIRCGMPRYCTWNC